MIYVISKATFGSYNVRDIQCNANWDCCPYSEYALIPESMVEGILATQGYCDITLNNAGTEVASFTAREIPSVPEECCGTNTVLSVNGVTANTSGEVTLTPENVGAAPAGYGLGEVTGRTITDFNAVIRSGFYHCNNSVNAPTEESLMAYGALLVEVRAPMIKQTLFYNGLQAVRYSGDNAKTWQPWEWVNPPMVGQLEYRTTERWNGKAVYTKLLNYGGMPGHTTYAIAHGCAATCILRYCAVNETLGIAIPNSTTSIAVDKNNISLTTNTTDVKGNIARIQIWYTKD